MFGGDKNKPTQGPQCYSFDKKGRCKVKPPSKPMQHKVRVKKKKSKDSGDKRAIPMSYS